MGRTPILLLRHHLPGTRWVAPGLSLGLALLLLGHAAGASFEVLRSLLLGVVLVAATMTDLRSRRIPNGLVLTGLVASLLLFAGRTPSALLVAAGAAGVASGLLFGVRLLGRLLRGRDGMGIGDVKLAAVMGLLLGWPVLWVLYLAVVLAGLFGIADLLVHRASRRTTLPFAPFLAAGTVLAWTLLPWPVMHDVLFILS